MSGLTALSILSARPARALPLAPLGGVQRIGGDKRTGLSPEEVKVRSARTPPEVAL